MRSQAEFARIPETGPQPTSQGGLTSRIDRLLREMTTVVPSSPGRWREPLRVLLTHARPTEGLRGFHKCMRAAIHKTTYDEEFVDRLLEALSATASTDGLREMLGPIRLALISFVGGISHRPSVLMTMVSKLFGGSDVAEPPRLTFATVERDSRTLPVGVIEAIGTIAMIVQRAVGVVLVQHSKGAHAFAAWSDEERVAALETLWLAYTYCEIGTAGRDKALGATELQADLRRFGTPLWRSIDRGFIECATRDAHSGKADRAAALARMTLLIGTLEERLGVDTATALPHLPVTTLASSRHVVCKSAIPASTDRQDQEEIARHRVLEQPLEIAVMPAVEVLHESLSRLLAEFPWSSGAIHAVFDDLVGRANLGVRELSIPATLLVGGPGAGKSRLARRIAEELGLPRLNVSLSGNSDTKLLSGTSRGWSNGRPSDLASLMARRRCACAIVLLDEIDKAVDGLRHGGGIAHYLLPLLEPETASSHYDSFLKTECDFSIVSWLCTANALSGISKPLQSRLRVLLIPQPRREDIPVICTSVIAELEGKWRVPSGTIPSAEELGLDMKQIASARQARVATEAAVSSWAKSIVRH